MQHSLTHSLKLVAAASLVLASACGAQENGTSGSQDEQALETGNPPVPTNVYGDSMPHPTVTLTTNLGDIELELFPEDAPESVENFLAYVEEGHYNGLIFHRVIPNFMVQAGGHTPDMSQREASRDPITNESDNGLHNLRGTVAMARTQAPHSAKAQFFINLVDNPNLDHRGVDNGWGYAVFGRVIDGMDVVDEIAAQPTGNAAGHQNVPEEPIIIELAERGEDIEPEG